MNLHERLIALQPTAELARKQRKAWTKHYWTQEDIDHAKRWADEMHEKLQWTDAPTTEKQPGQ